jgi:hypothetical protein
MKASEECKITGYFLWFLNFTIQNKWLLQMLSTSGMKCSVSKHYWYSFLPLSSGGRIQIKEISEGEKRSMKHGSSKIK